MGSTKNTMEGMMTKLSNVMGVWETTKQKTRGVLHSALTVLEIKVQPVVLEEQQPSIKNITIMSTITMGSEKYTEKYTQKYTEIY